MSKTKKDTIKPKKNKEEKVEQPEETEQDATVLYIGHLPSEFEERDLKNFLKQFGKVVNIRISRSPKSGQSRGYAFVRWEDAETARIVADTLHGYFVGQRRLICHVLPNPHRSLFFNTDKIIQRRKLRLQVVDKERERQLNNVEKIKTITARLVLREHKKRAKLEALGIDYDFPGYEASQVVDDDDDDEKMKPEDSASKSRSRSRSRSRSH